MKDDKWCMMQIHSKQGLTEKVVTNTKSKLYFYCVILGVMLVASWKRTTVIFTLNWQYWNCKYNYQDFKLEEIDILKCRPQIQQIGLSVREKVKGDKGTVDVYEDKWDSNNDK